MNGEGEDGGVGVYTFKNVIRWNFKLWRSIVHTCQSASQLSRLPIYINLYFIQSFIKKKPKDIDIWIVRKWKEGNEEKKSKHEVNIINIIYNVCLEKALVQWVQLIVTLYIYNTFYRSLHKKLFQTLLEAHICIVLN